MDLDKLYKKLNLLNQQKQAIEKEIQNIKQQIQKYSSLTKEEKIELFKSLFIVPER